MELRDYLRVLARRKTTIIATILLFIAVALLAESLRKPTYTAESTVLVGQTDAASRLLGVGSDASAIDPGRQMETAARLMVSSGAARSVIDSLHLKTTPEALLEQVSAKPVEGSDLIVVKATDVNPTQAASISNAFAEAFVKRQVAAQKASIAAARDELERQRKAASDRLSRTKLSDGGITPEQQVLVASVTRLSDQLEKLRTGSAIVLDTTRVASKADAPKSAGVLGGVIPTVLLGLALGTASGVGIAFGAEHVQTRVRGAEDLRGLPVRVVGAIPAEHPGRVSSAPIMLKDPASRGADAYRLLRLAYRNGSSRPGRVLVVASDEDTRGGGLVAMNLAIALVQAGSRVSLVDCDVRHTPVRSAFDLSGDSGLTDVLAGRPLAEVVQHPFSQSLAVIASGGNINGMAEALCGQRMKATIAELAAASDVVIICSPPLMHTAEAAGLFEVADRLLLVLTAGRSRRESAELALGIVATSGRELPIDAVIRGADAEKDPSILLAARPSQDAAEQHPSSEPAVNDGAVR